MSLAYIQHVSGTFYILIGYITGIFWATLKYIWVHLKYISGISWVYLSHIIYISHVHLRYISEISGIFKPYFKFISDLIYIWEISQVYLDHIRGTSYEYLKHSLLSGISWAVLRHILGLFYPSMFPAYFWLISVQKPKFVISHDIVLVKLISLWTLRSSQLMQVPACYSHCICQFVPI